MVFLVSFLNNVLGYCAERGCTEWPDVGRWWSDAGVADDMSIARDEIFGPVMCTFKFKTLEEVGKS